MLHSNWSKYIIVLSVALVTALGVVGISTAFGGREIVEAASRQQWEYLTVHYSQYTDYSEGAEDPIEVVFSNDLVYDVALYGDLICQAGIFDADGSCIGLFRGQAYYLNLWGNDGWELVNINDKSTQYTYSVEMIFKRPR